MVSSHYYVNQLLNHMQVLIHSSALCKGTYDQFYYKDQLNHFGDNIYIYIIGGFWFLETLMV